MEMALGGGHQKNVSIILFVTLEREEMGTDQTGSPTKIQV